MRLLDLKYLSDRERLDRFSQMDPNDQVPVYLVAGLLHYIAYGSLTPNGYEILEPTGGFVPAKGKVAHERTA
jgi:hypothetical protein